MIELRTALLASLLCFAAPAGAHAETLPGRTQVVDGDSLVVAGGQMRLHAIDARRYARPWAANPSASSSGSSGGGWCGARCR